MGTRRTPHSEHCETLWLIKDSHLDTTCLAWTKDPARISMITGDACNWMQADSVLMGGNCKTATNASGVCLWTPQRTYQMRNRVEVTIHRFE